MSLSSLIRKNKVLGDIKETGNFNRLKSMYRSNIISENKYLRIIKDMSQEIRSIVYGKVNLELSWRKLGELENKGFITKNQKKIIEDTSIKIKFWEGFEILDFNSIYETSMSFASLFKYG